MATNPYSWNLSGNNNLSQAIQNSNGGQVMPSMAPNNQVNVAQSEGSDSMGGSVGKGALSGAASGAAMGSMFGPWGTAIGGIAGAALGGFQAYQGYEGLKEINKNPYPTHGITPEQQNSFDRAEQLAKQGYTGAEIANYQQNLSRANNTGFRNAMNVSGGNLASALHRGVNAQNVGALNQFAASDAGLRRQNMHYADQQGGEISNQRNLITNAAIQRRNQLESAYGGAMQTGLTNLANSANQYSVRKTMEANPYMYNDKNVA